MSLKKDSKKSKDILLGIDIVLAVLALAMLCCCSYLLLKLNGLPGAEEMEVQIRNREEKIVQLAARIEERSKEVADAEWEATDALTAAQADLAVAQEELDVVSAEHGALQLQVDRVENFEDHEAKLREDIARIRTEYGQAVRKLEEMILAGESDYRICYLTFDDGPSYLTTNFLDKLDAHDIYVTFFTIGVQMGDTGAHLRDQLLRREALAGHALANHTYTHGIYTDLYDSLDNFMDAVKRQDALINDVVGYHPDVLRFPAGSYYCPFREAAIAELEKMGYGWIDWIGNAYDSGTHTQESKTVSANVIWQVSQDQVTVVLMHDWRSETLGALDDIIRTLKAKNYLFLPLFKESITVGTARPKWDG